MIQLILQSPILWQPRLSHRTFGRACQIQPDILPLTRMTVGLNCQLWLGWNKLLGTPRRDFHDQVIWRGRSIQNVCGQPRPKEVWGEGPRCPHTFTFRCRVGLSCCHFISSLIAEAGFFRLPSKLKARAPQESLEAFRAALRLLRHPAVWTQKLQDSQLLQCKYSHCQITQSVPYTYIKW